MTADEALPITVTALKTIAEECRGPRARLLAAAALAQVGETVPEAKPFQPQSAPLGPDGFPLPRQPNPRAALLRRQNR